MTESSPHKTYRLIDIQSIDSNDCSGAVKEFQIGEVDRAVKCDVLIVGGGLGAVAAAHALTRVIPNGKKEKKNRIPKVCLLEETNWLGGQATSQGVSALDENYLVETCGASKHYLDFRRLIRDYYLDRYSLKNGTDTERFNPGNCWVSRLAFEPKVGLYAIDTMLEKAIKDGKLTIFHRTKTVFLTSEKLKTGRTKIKSVTAVNLESGESIQFKAKHFIDATELGDLLPMANLQYVFGQESAQDTGEPHAASQANSEIVQDYVYPFAVEFCPDQDHTISKPPEYSKFLDAGQFSLLGYKMFEETRDGPKQLLPFWTYRRLIDRDTFNDLAYSNDLAMINWESNDVSNRNLIDQPLEVVASNLSKAKKISLGFLYWLQTEAPRDSQNKGFPELKLRQDVMASNDGLSKFPYIRESRRIKAEKLVRETDIAEQYNSTARAKFFKDSVGIGLYPIDIHGPQEEGAAQKTKPFQIPMGALIPKDSENLLPACKNIGVSHITNGAYRLHPIEWAIGTATGTIIRESLKSSTEPYKLFFDKSKLLSLQEQLVSEGEPLYWFDDVPVDHPYFAEIQFLAMTGVMPSETDSLHFYPDKPISRQLVAKMVARILDKSKVSHQLVKDVDDDHPFSRFIFQAIHLRLLDLDRDFKFRPSAPITVEELQDMANNRYLKLPKRTSDTINVLAETTTNLQAPVTRAQFAEWISAVITYKKRWNKLAEQLKEGP